MSVWDKSGLISAGLQPGDERKFSLFSPNRADAIGRKRGALYLVPALKHGANKNMELSRVSLSHMRGNDIEIQVLRLDPKLEFGIENFERVKIRLTVVRLCEKTLTSGCCIVELVRNIS